VFRENPLFHRFESTPVFCIYFWGSLTLCASPPPWASIFSDYSFWVHHFVNWDDGHSLHMQWPLTSQSHGSVSPREQLVFCWIKLHARV
jgi:hypothetical protein